MERQIARDALGVLIVVSILASIAFVTAFGAGEYLKFLNGGAAGWAQALGSIGAILAGFAYVDLQHRHQAERDRESAGKILERQMQAVFAAVEQAEEVASWISCFTSDDPVPESTMSAIQIAAREALDAFKSISFVDIPDPLLLQRWGASRKDLVTVLIHCHVRRPLTPGNVDSDSYLSQFLPSYSYHLSLVKQRATSLSHLKPLPPP